MLVDTFYEIGDVLIAHNAHGDKLVGDIVDMCVHVTDNDEVIREYMISCDDFNYGTLWVDETQVLGQLIAKHK